MRIAGVASALPRHYYPQAVLMNALKQHWNGRLPNPTSVERFFSKVSVGGRYLAYPLQKYLELDSFGKSNSHWIRAAEDLGQQAICRATARAGVQPRDIDALFFVSVTGVASPSIDARLINRMGLSPNLKRIPISDSAASLEPPVSHAPRTTCAHFRITSQPWCPLSYVR